MFCVLCVVTFSESELRKVKIVLINQKCEWKSISFLCICECSRIKKIANEKAADEEAAAEKEKLGRIMGIKNNTQPAIIETARNVNLSRDVLAAEEMRNVQ